MSQTDEERLVILLEARIKDLERNMAKASGTTEREFRKMSQSSKSATRQMEQDALRSTTRINQAFAQVGTKIGNYGKAFGAGLLGGIAGVGISGIISTLGTVAKNVAQIGDEAKRAGLSIQAFQELKFVAEQNRIGVDSLVDGIKELNLRADEFVATGGGSAAEAFGRLGYSADQLKTKLKDPSALFTEIIGKLGELDRAAQIRIADELFGGTGGEKFVQLIEQGQAGIKATIREAHSLGNVMSDELVAKADELDKKFNQITTSVGTGLKKAVVEAAGALQGFVNIFQQYEQRKRAAELGAQVGAMVNMKPDPNRVMTTPKTGRLAEATTPVPSQEELSTKYLASYRAELALTSRERAIAAESEKILAEAASRGLKVTKEQAEALAREKVARDEGEASAKKLGSERERAGKRAESETKKIQDLIAELEEELRVVNLSDEAKRASVASRQAGAAATEEERRKIIALNEAIYKEQEAQDEAEKQRMFYRDLTRAGLDDLFGALEEGKSFWEAMGDVAVNSLKRIADSLLDDVLDSIFKVNNAAKGGGGGGGGFFSSLLGGLFGGGGGFPAMPAFGGGGGSGIGLYAKGDAFSGGINGFSNQVVSKPTMFAFADGAGLMGEAGPEAIMPLTRDASGRLGVAAHGGSSQSGEPSAPATNGGTSEVIVNLSPELVGQILKQAQGQTLKIVQGNNKQQAEFRTNGGNH
ncbi:hypothetical protein [Agrobacterium rosae]|uniref:phage tail tape measure protein n=1 Tax=Agrobacterium rosae TaxID=1972867 RepID=UPI003B9E264D